MSGAGIPIFRIDGMVARKNIDNAFTAAQTINTGSGTLPAAISTPALRIASASFAGIEGAAAGAAGILLVGRASGGSWAGVAATDSNRNMINLAAYGHDGTNWLTTPSAVQRILAGSLWSGSSQETIWTWEATPASSTTRAEWMRLQGGASEPSGKGSLCVGTTLATGNGLLQLASGTTKANGIAFGTDTFLYRSAAGKITIDGTADGVLTVGGKITAKAAVPASFADLAAVRTYLASILT
jgi:hypothetical protein